MLGVKGCDSSGGGDDTYTAAESHASCLSSNSFPVAIIIYLYLSLYLYLYSSIYASIYVSIYASIYLYIHHIYLYNQIIQYSHCNLIAVAVVLLYSSDEKFYSNMYFDLIYTYYQSAHLTFST